MKPLNNIKKIIKRDNKLEKFKMLISHAAPILTSLPVLAATALSIWTPLTREILAFAVGGYATIILPLTLTNKLPNICKQKGLKDNLNKIAQRQYRKEEQKLIDKLRKDDSIETIIEISTFLTINSRLIALWNSRNAQQSIIREPTFYEIEEYADIGRPLQFKMREITDFVEKRIESLDPEVLKEEKQKCIEKMYKSEALPLLEVEPHIIDFILSTNGYNIFKEKDYINLGKLIKQGKNQVLQLMINNDYQCTIDWNRVIDLFKNNNSTIAGDYIRILQELQEKEPTSIASTPSDNILKKYKPNVHKKLWQELIHIYSIVLNQERAGQEQLDFEDKVEKIIPTLIKTDRYLKSFNEEEQKNNPLTKELELNIQAVTTTLKAMNATYHEYLQKELRVHNKFMKAAV